MKNTSSFQIALLASFGALAIAGVIIFSFYISKGPETAVGPVVVWGTFEEQAVLAALAELSSTQPNLQNVTYVQKSEAAYSVELLNAFASGASPDLFFLTEEQAYVEKSRVAQIPMTEITPELFGTAFVDGAQPFLDVEGTIALPVVVDPLVLYWNKDLLAAAGFSKPPQYWDELLDYSQRLTKKSESGSLERSAISFGAYSNVDHAKEILTMLMIQAGGSITARDGSGRLVAALLAQNRGAAASAAVPSAVRFYTEFADPSKPGYSWNRSFPRSQRAFVSGTLALYVGRASELLALKAANPNLNFAVAPVPQIRGVGTSAGGLIATGGVVYGIAMPKAAKNPRGALVIQWLLSSKEVSAALSKSLGMPSARRDVLDEQRRSRETDLLATQAIITRSWTDPDPAKTDTIFRAMIEDMTSGSVLLSEAITRADQQINGLVGI